MSSFDIDDAAITAKLRRLSELNTVLPEIAQKVQDEALGHMILSARRSIYDTAPGVYQRTGALLRGLKSTGRATANTITVQVSGEVPYQADVELGQGPNMLNVRQLQGYARANPNPLSPLYFGRTGQKYSLPAPIVSGAQAFAAFQMRQLFIKAIRDVR